jgi:hypothetical protein
MKFSKLCILLAVVVLGFSETVNAELVRVQVSATVEDVYDPGNVMGGAVQIGTKVTGTYTFDTATPDADEYPDFGHYRHPLGVGGFDLSVGGLSVKTDNQAPAGLFAVDVINSSTDEGYHVVSFDNLLPWANGARLDNASIDLHKWSDGVMESDALPSSPPNPLLFEDRSLSVGGETSSSNYFSFHARIDSLVLDGETDSEANTGAYSIVARVMDVYDPASILQGQVQIEDEISGSYQLEPSLTDRNSDPEWAEYEHPLAPGYGFELTLNGLTFATDSTSSPVSVVVANGVYDHYGVWTYGATSNGNFLVDNLSLYLDDNSGTALSSTSLIQTPDPTKFDGPRELYISGQNSQGDFFEIRAEVLSITAAGNDDTDEPELILLPANGKVLPGQQFDLGIVLAPGEHPLFIEGSVNGHSTNSWFDSCYLNSSSTSDSHYFICPQVNYLLDPTSNISTVNVRVTLEGGETRSAEVQWEMIRR